MWPRAELRQLIRFQRERMVRMASRRRLDPDTERAGSLRVTQSRTAGEMACALTQYLWMGLERYLDRHGTAAYYPGEPSIYGARNDGIEGVTRSLPLFAAYVSWTHADPAIAGPMRTAVSTALDHGTDPSHPGYWGDMGPRSTLICEAADVALAAWLLREQLDVLLEPAAKSRLCIWLSQALVQDTADNNWHLFVALVDACLIDLAPGHTFRSTDRLQRVQGFSAGNGCFRDGPRGRVDFYNAWAFHYAIFWLKQLHAPDFPPPWEHALSDFWAWYRQLFAMCGGLPLFGRSLCYRFATPVPLLAMAIEHPDQAGIAAEAARRFVTTTRFFAQRGGLHRGCFSQGVFGPDIRWLDPYSGPASALWGARAAILFFYGQRHVQWAAIEELAIEPATAQDGKLAVPGLGALIVIDAANDRRRVEFVNPGTNVPSTPVHTRPRDHLRQIVRAQASRPQNNLLDLAWRHFDSDLHEYA